MIITIDGPAGSGKSTVAARLARMLGVAYLDTGAMYRAVTLAAMQQGVALEDRAALGALAGHVRIQFVGQGELNQILLDGQDVTDAIRTPEVTANSRFVADVAEVRTELVRQQQRIGREAGALVTEGRDQGTIVFPRAQYKFYLTADPETRAQRRTTQLQSNGLDADVREILKAQQDRDHRDQSRPVGALKPADDAVVVDTSELGVDEVVLKLLSYIQAKGTMGDVSGEIF